MKLFREWCSRVNRRRGRMVPVSAIATLESTYDPGYMSVYMFNEEDAHKIIASGVSQGFDKYEVYSDTIYIDIDSGEQDLKHCLAKLDEEGLGYYVYDSGSKGHHVVVPLDKTYSGKNVPHSQLEWVKSKAIQCDYSIYRAGSLISLPGRVHSKTGKKKKLISKKDGAPARLTLVDPPKLEFTYGDDKESLKIGLSQLYLLAANPPLAGQRHLSLWKTSKSLAEAGVEFETALELLIAVNDSWPEPKDSSDVEKAVRAAYAS